MASKIRDRIVDHAISCFAARGYAGSSTKEIATRADVTEGSLFRLFGTKEKLFAEVLEQVRLRNMLPQDEFDRLLNSGTIEEGIHAAFVALYKKISPDAVRISKFAILENGARAVDVLAPVYEVRVKSIAKRIRAGIVAGEVRKNVDANVAARAIYSSIRNLAFDLLFPKISKRAQLVTVEKFLNLWLSAILK